MTQRGVKSPPKSGTGNHTIVITVDENETNEERQCTVTFSNSHKILKLSVTQYQVIESDYVDMKLDHDSVLVDYDQNSGDVSIQYQTVSVPSVKPGQAIVLPEACIY